MSFQNKLSYCQLQQRNRVISWIYRFSWRSKMTEGILKRKFAEVRYSGILSFFYLQQFFLSFSILLIIYLLAENNLRLHVMSKILEKFSTNVWRHLEKAPSLYSYAWFSCNILVYLLLNSNVFSITKNKSVLQQITKEWSQPCCCFLNATVQRLL